MSIDMASILKKAEAYVESPKGKQKTAQITSDALSGKITLESSGNLHTPEEAADKFIGVLRDSIKSSDLSPNAIEAISEINHTSASKIGDNTYVISVYFSGDLSRPSLDPSRFGDGIGDIVELLNNGVDHTMRPVFGVWHGKETWSMTKILGAHFIEQAISDFMGNYSSEYNVTDIRVNYNF